MEKNNIIIRKLAKMIDMHLSYKIRDTFYMILKILQYMIMPIF